LEPTALGGGAAVGSAARDHQAALDAAAETLGVSVAALRKCIEPSASDSGQVVELLIEQQLLSGRTRQLDPNQVISLHDASKCWLVRQGEVAVVSSQVDNDTPTGQRRFLFEARQGQVLFCCAPRDDTEILSFIGIAAGHAEVLEIELSAVAALFRLRVKAVHDWLSRWLHELSQLMAEDRELPAALARVEEFGEIELGPRDALAPQPGELLWIRVDSGQVTAMGEESALLAAGDGCMLLSDAYWVEAAADAVQLMSWDAGGIPQSPPLEEALGNLHRCFNTFLLRRKREQAGAILERRTTSQKQQEAQTAEALRQLSSVLDPGEHFAVGESPLLTAASIVGQVQGIAIRPPAKSEDRRRLADPVLAIARASKVRARKVVLGPTWKEQDRGPLLGYLTEPKKWVALLPKGGGWQVVDPENPERRPLTEEVEEQLDPSAYIFYRPLPETAVGLKAVLLFTMQGRYGDLVFSMLMGLCATVLGMIVPQAMGVLIDIAIPDADRGLLFQLVAILTVAGLAQAALSWIQTLTMIRVGSLTEVAMQAAVWDRLLKFRPAFFRQFSSGELLYRVNTLSEIARTLRGAALRPLITGPLALLNLGLCWYYSAKLALVAVAVSVVIATTTIVAGNVIRRLSLKYHELASPFEGMLLQLIGGVSKLRLARAERRAFNLWVRKYAALVRLRLRIDRWQDGVRVFNALIKPLCTGVLFWIGADLVLAPGGASADALSIGDFLAFNAAFFLFMGGVIPVAETVVEVLETLTRAKLVEPLLEETPEVMSDAADPGHLKGNISLENVSFRYQQDGRLILDDFSCEIRAGEFVAFVGPSGSGKTTVLRLMLGFERPEYGRVLYDGKDVASHDVTAIRRQVGTVLQDGRLQTGSVFENVANNLMVSHAEVWDALADAGLKEDIEKMPMGLSTVVSEGGGNLSGGQRQRLLIARALVQKPTVMLFDEATSALDNRTQAIVSRALERRRVTRVVIAHRLSTIQRADRIYVVKAGKTVQCGTFDELSHQPGLFRDLMVRQML